MDVAVGLALVYFLLSVLVTALTEAVSALTARRSRKLESWLGKALSPAGQTNGALVGTFKNSPAYQALQLSAGHRSNHGPSYIPAAHFIDGVLHAAQPVENVPADVTVVKTAAGAWVSIGTDLASLEGTPVGDALLDVYQRANGDVNRFRRDAEGWFDDQMERLSGAYKRWASIINALLGLGVVVALNANTVRIVQLMWTDPATRSAVVASAGSAGNGRISTSTAITTLQGLPLPLGWSGGWTYHSWSTNLYALFGAVLTLAAISLGAPFWFDTLSKLARIRTTGTPPVVTGGTRSGDGDQQRTGAALTAPAELVATPGDVAAAADEVRAAEEGGRAAGAAHADQAQAAEEPPRRA